MLSSVGSQSLEIIRKRERASVGKPAHNITGTTRSPLESFRKRGNCARPPFEELTMSVNSALCVGNGSNWRQRSASRPVQIRYART